MRFIAVKASVQVWLLKIPLTLNGWIGTYPHKQAIKSAAVEQLSRFWSDLNYMMGYNGKAAVQIRMAWECFTSWHWTTNASVRVEVKWSEVSESFGCLLMYFTSLSVQLTALQAKVHYLRYLSELRLYGGREFNSILLVRPLVQEKVL